MRRPDVRIGRRVHGLGILLLCCSAGVVTASATEATPGTDPAQDGTPALQLADAGFPELLMRLPRFDAVAKRLPLACDRIRPRRIDELDPGWKRAVQRIHLECEPLPAVEEGAPDTIATVTTAYLHPGSARFLDWPAVEVRLMDSNLWSDHQYVLDTPYPELIDSLQRLLVARCKALQDDPAMLIRGDCKVTRTGQGMYIDSNGAGGSWVHPDPHDPKRTVYAEGWAE